MYCISVSDFSSWRENARWLVANKVKPESVQWTDGVQQSLFVPSVSLGDNVSAGTSLLGEF